MVSFVFVVFFWPFELKWVTVVDSTVVDHLRTRLEALAVRSLDLVGERKLVGEAIVVGLGYLILNFWKLTPSKISKLQLAAVADFDSESEVTVKMAVLCRGKQLLDTNKHHCLKRYPM